MLLIPMILIFGGISAYSYYGSRSMLNEQIIQTAGYLVESYSNNVYSSLKEKEVLVSMTAKILGERELSQTEKIAFLQQVKGSWPGVKSPYTGYEDKSCEDSQAVTEKKATGYDPRMRGWYKTVKEGDEIGNLTRSFQRMTLNLRELISKVYSSAGNVANAAEQFAENYQQSAEAAGSVAASIDHVMRGAETQVKAVNEVSAVVENISANIEELATTSNQMAEVADKAALATDNGQNSVNKAINPDG